nr:reverse transcriptase domain-containing protein [Tanacetum cinerariifolium]
MPTYRTIVVDAMHNDEKLRLNLDLLEERRERAAIHEAKAKSKMRKYYNARAILESGLEKEAATIRPLVNKRRDKRVNEGVEANAPPMVLRKDHVTSRALQSTLGGKSLATIKIETDSTSFAPVTQETPVNVSDPDPLSSSKRTPAVEDLDSKKSTSFTSMVGSSGIIYQQGGQTTKNAVAQVARREQRIEAREKHIKNLKALLEAEADMKQRSTVPAIVYSSGSNLDDERIKATFKEFKKYENDRVTARCAEMNARLDALSIDFDDELYPHMLKAITRRRWVIGHGLRLAVMKYAESIELRQVFVDVVFVGIAKGLSEGLKHEVEHGKAKVHNSKDAWSFKEEILLEDDISANISHAEKKKKYRVVCHTHRVSSAHHARSDGVPLLVHIVAPQGLAILLVDATT